jgi:WD40 repeat protein
MFLTSGDWTFTIWKLDFETPVFVSPYAHDYITAARWSPTRPGVIVAALANGQIDVWDFLDQCHKPTLTHPTGIITLFQLILYVQFS